LIPSIFHPPYPIFRVSGVSWDELSGRSRCSILAPEEVIFHILLFHLSRSLKSSHPGSFLAVVAIRNSSHLRNLKTIVEKGTLLCQDGWGNVWTGGQGFADNDFFLPCFEQASTLSQDISSARGIGPQRRRPARDSLRPSRAMARRVSVFPVAVWRGSPAREPR
jgi:hypothetical protein